MTSRRDEPFRIRDHIGVISGLFLGLIALLFLVALALLGDEPAITLLVVLVVGIAMIRDRIAPSGLSAMATYRDQGVVLRTMKLGEADRIVTFATQSTARSTRSQKVSGSRKAA